VLASDREEKLLQLAQAGGELDALVAGQVEEHVAQEPRLVALDSEWRSKQGRGGSDKLVTQGPELPEVRGVRSVDERGDSCSTRLTSPALRATEPAASLSERGRSR